MMVGGLRQQLRLLLLMFVIGAVVSPLGDHMHVASDTTAYHTDVVPFVWRIPITFPVMVGVATAVLGGVRLRLAAPRPGIGIRQAVGSVAAVMIAYAASAAGIPASSVATALVAGVAVVSTCVLADRPALVCGVLAAVGGPLVEIAGVHAGLFSYADDALLGVAPWLPALYFGFGVAAAVIAEALVQCHGVRSSDRSVHRAAARPHDG